MLALCLFQLGAPPISSVFAFSEKIPPRFSLALPPAAVIPVSFSSAIPTSPPCLVLKSPLPTTGSVCIVAGIC